MDRAWWWDVAPDVLRDIAGRLHDAADFVRFHSVCKPWRDSFDARLFRTTKSRFQFMPWLLASRGKELTAPLKLRCIFSKSSFRATPLPPQPVPRRNWICRADGTAVRYMTVEHLRPSVHDPINNRGEVTHLPRFRWDEGDPHGIVYGDGAVLLYSVVQLDGGTARFRAALLRPGDAKWTLVKRTFENPMDGEFCVAYHRGKILVTFEAALCHLITPDCDGGGVSTDLLVPRPYLVFPELQYSHTNSYIMESRGELLWVSVDASISNAFHAGGGGGPARVLSVSVHVLEEEASCWVKKDSSSLADRVFFLGSPNSFAIDASQLGGHGGWAFFVYSDTKALPAEQFGVFKYNLIDCRSDFVEQLPPGWGDDKCAWLVPQPAIAPTQEITKRKELMQQRRVPTLTGTSHMVRHYEPSITVLVRNLPPSVKTPQLQLFFSNHGKVSHTQVIYHEKTKTWQGIVTITTNHAYREDAIDALNGLLFDGRSLEISLFKEENRRRRHGRVLQQ